MKHFDDLYSEISRIFHHMNEQFSVVKSEVRQALSSTMGGIQRVYLSGTFEAFLADAQLLEIITEKGRFYYPLAAYEGCYLPVPDNQVLIFQSGEPGNHRVTIKGFEAFGRAIPPARRINLQVVGLDCMAQQVVLRHPFYGQIRVNIPDELLAGDHISVGKFVQVKEIESAPDVFWCLESFSDSNDSICRKSVLKSINGQG